MTYRYMIPHLNDKGLQVITYLMRALEIPDSEFYMREQVPMFDDTFYFNCEEKHREVIWTFIELNDLAYQVHNDRGEFVASNL